MERVEETQISLEEFWERYHYKADKKRSEDPWRKLKPEEQKKSDPVFTALFEGVAQDGCYADVYKNVFTQ